jgi:hypothetical protein
MPAGRLKDRDAGQDCRHCKEIVGPDGFARQSRSDDQRDYRRDVGHARGLNGAKPIHDQVVEDVGEARAAQAEPERQSGKRPGVAENGADPMQVGRREQDQERDADLVVVRVRGDRPSGLANLRA